MAVELVASSAAYNGLFADPEIGRPAGYGTTWTTGAIVVIYAAFFDTDVPPTWADFTLIRSGGGSPTFGAWYAKEAGAAEPAVYTSAGSATPVYTSHCAALTGAVMPTASDSHSSSNSGSGTTRTGLSVTAGSADALLLLGLTGYDSAATAVTDMLEIASTQDVDNAWYQTGIASGSTGNRTGTGTSSAWAALMLAIDAPGGAAPPASVPLNPIMFGAPF